MANPFASYQYRDPEALSIDNLGKAALIKDERYDANFYKTQELINQYAGTDLLKDVDKQYLGERLNTLVNYVNQEGTTSWDNKKLTSQIQTYISGAIDKNVMNAISSTQTYKKQMADINEIKSKKPELYSMQNEWFATSDLQRYLSSNVVGDSYRANSYMPYTDVNKKILDNSKLLKDFGVEYYQTESGNNGFFRTIGTHEKVDPARAQQFLGSILNSQDMNQLYIDGQYQYKNLDSDSVKQVYDDKLNQYKNFNNRKIDELKTLAVSANKNDKSNYQQLISAYEEKNQDINKSGQTKLSKEAMVDYVHRSSFMDKWTGMLSYDRITDFEIDDSGFQVAKYNTDIQQDNRDYALRASQFQYNIGQDQIKNSMDQQKLELDAYSKGFKSNGQGGWELDPSNPNNPTTNGSALGGTVTDLPKDQEEVETPDAISTAQDEFYKSKAVLESTVSNEIQQMIQSDDNPALKAEMRGVTNPKYVTYTLLNSPSKTSVIYQNLSEASKREVDLARSRASQLKDINESLKPIVSDTKALAKAVVSNNSKASLQQAYKDSSFGYIIDKKGNLTNGDVLKDVDKMSPYLSRLVTAFNYRLRSERLSDEDTVAMKTALRNELRTQTVIRLDAKQVDTIMNQMVYKKGVRGEATTGVEGFGNALGSAFGAINPFKGLWGSTKNAFNYYVADSIDEATYDKLEKQLDSDINKTHNPVRARNTQGIDAIGSIFTANEGTNGIGMSDIDVKALGFAPSELEGRTRQHLTGAYNKARSAVGQQFNKSINIGTGTKTGEATIEQLKTLYPVATQFQTGSTANVVVDQQKGVASITMGVKDGKEYVPQTIEVPLANMPSTVLNTIKPEPTTRLYSASNPYAVSYQKEIELPDNQDDYEKQVSLMRKDRREEALANPSMTKQDIIDNLYNSFGADIVDANAQEIKKILDAPVTFSTLSENNQWTTVATQNGSQIFNKKTGQEDYNPNLIDQHVNKLATDIILSKIQTVLNKNQNGRTIKY